jgi:hypothetical protein
MVDFLFDGSGREQSVDGDVTTLTDSPSSLSTLHVGTWVPVGIENDHPANKQILNNS